MFYSICTDYPLQRYYGDIYHEPDLDVASDDAWQAEKWDSLTRSWCDIRDRIQMHNDIISAGQVTASSSLKYNFSSSTK